MAKKESVIQQLTTDSEGLVIFNLPPIAKDGKLSLMLAKIDKCN